MNWLQLALAVVSLAQKIVEKLRPVPVLNPEDASLWHTAHYDGATISCTVCHRVVFRVAELCTEQVRRRLE